MEEEPCELPESLCVAVYTGVCAHNVLDGFDGRGVEGHVEVFSFQKQLTRRFDVDNEPDADAVTPWGQR